MSIMNDTGKPAPAVEGLTSVVCPRCETDVPVACGDVTGLRLDEVIAIALAKADRHHQDAGDGPGHRLVRVTVADPVPPPRYLQWAAEILSGALGLPGGADVGGARPRQGTLFRVRPPEEVRRMLRQSDLPIWFVTAILEELGIAENPTT